MVYSLEHHCCYTYNTNFDYQLASRQHPIFHYKDTTYELNSNEYNGCITIGIKVVDMITKEISVEGRLISVSMEMADEPIIFCVYRNISGFTCALLASVLGEDRNYETYQLPEEFQYAFVYAEGERLVLTSRGIYRLSSETFVSFFDEIGSVRLLQYSGDNEGIYICSNTVDHKSMLFQLRIKNDKCVIINKKEMKIYFKKFVVKNHKMFAEAILNGENAILYSPDVFENDLQFILSGASNIKDMGKISIECDDGTFIEVEEYGDDYDVKFKKMSISIIPIYFFSSSDKANIRNVMMTECKIYKDKELSDEINNITIYTDEYTSLIINENVYYVDSGKPITVPVTCGNFTILEEVFDGISGSSYTIEFADIKEVIDPNESVINEIKTINEKDLNLFSIGDDKEKCKEFLDALDILKTTESMTEVNSLDDCFYFIQNDDGTYESGRGVIKRRIKRSGLLKSIWNSLKKFTSAVYHGVAKITTFIKEKMNIFIEYIVDGIKYTIEWICDTAEKLIHSFLSFVSRLGNIIVDIGKFLCRLFNIGDVFRNAKEIENSFNDNLDMLIDKFNDSDTRLNMNERVKNEINEIYNKKNETAYYLEKEKENLIKQDSNEESDKLSQNNYVAYSLISENKENKRESIFNNLFMNFIDSVMLKYQFNENKEVFDNIFNKIKNVITKGNILSNILNIFCETIEELIESVKNVSNNLLPITIDLIGSILYDFKVEINKGIPIISSICKYLGLGKVSWLSLMCLVTAVPYTIFTKIKKMTRTVATSCITLCIQMAGGVFKIPSVMVPKSNFLKIMCSIFDYSLTISMIFNVIFSYGSWDLIDAIVSNITCAFHYAISLLYMNSDPLEDEDPNIIVKMGAGVTTLCAVCVSIACGIKTASFNTLPNTIILCIRGIINEVIDTFFKDTVTTKKIIIGVEMVQMVSGAFTLAITVV